MPFSPEEDPEHPGESHSLIACVGSGLSAIALGAQLRRWYGITDVVFFERLEQLGGTWLRNTYPGAACDVPSALYSFSFEKRPDWSCLYPPANEIQAYAAEVAVKYDLVSKMRFRSEVERCDWDEASKQWVITILDLRTKSRRRHTCRVLFSCAGFLATPQELDWKGKASFRGHIVHSSQWHDGIDTNGKRVVVVGNGCTAAQLVPGLLEQSSLTHMTQIGRSKQWLFPPLQIKYSSKFRWALRNIPGVVALHRLYVFLLIELLFLLFYTNWLGRYLRQLGKPSIEQYMRENSPPSLHDQLIPKYELGCKRGVIDRGYLKALHDPRLVLESRQVTQVVEDGLQLEDGSLLEADLLILANGYKTNKFLDPLTITGVEGRSLQDHWSHYGGPGAYNGSALHGFPNFFMILGPNSASGHTSAIIAAENSINYALRILKPLVRGSTHRVEVKRDAEQHYIEKVQRASRERVWGGTCSSWVVTENKWNGMLYPWSLTHYWYQSLFPAWKDWNVS